MLRVILLLFSLTLIAACGPDEKDENMNTEDSQESEEVVENAESEDQGESETDEPEENKDRSEDGQFTDKTEVLTTNLEIPWTISKTDERLYVTERAGRLYEINLDGEKNEQSLNLPSPVHHEGEGGLLGFELVPPFEESQQAFAYYTYQDSGETFNKVVLLEKDDEEWTETSILLDEIPSERIHNGGRLKVGPDEKLYITTGDAATPALSQDRNSLAGKILRMNLDGTIPSDNPFDDSYVYSYGHRNPQGLAWGDDGTMYSSEHGQSAHDEINLIEAGNNYGWPEIEGDETSEGMETPFYHTGEETWAPSGISFHNEKLYIATLRGSRIIKLDLSTKDAETAEEGFGRMRDVYIQDGSIFAITSNRDGRGSPTEEDDRLIRINIGEDE
ncbi:quinoprotein glucose dehydrogenase [Halalkalibacillus sediminis]|uniref:Quinoprotein glucose dehydrogenase n=1 Tax=Halalkalibacillus sediminis TaxID=2018042 RepID=A0A2I0QSJ9_9BACI|nr:PQQ-dependent sugar dehydrogenase [Halalkalibacillus sediminis]PKR77311.1 quinoprotein glucose dehydrogenase [Halalkalibacillus sediminis]